MLHRIRFILHVFTLLISLFTLQVAQASTIQLPQTGQTKCYDAAGTEITPCTLPAATGQDANILAGKPWPAVRFTDNANGTVTDNLTGLIWLKNANCWGAKPWQTALTNANSLKGDNTMCTLNDGSVAGDWRLPNRKELESLVDAQNVNPALPTGHPFSNVQSSDYWSGSTSSYGTASAWFVNMNDGRVNSSNKTGNVYVWPVRAGQ